MQGKFTIPWSVESSPNTFCVVTVPKTAWEGGGRTSQSFWGFKNTALASKNVTSSSVASNLLTLDNWFHAANPQFLALPLLLRGIKKTTDAKHLFPKLVLSCQPSFYVFLKFFFLIFI